jgi:hypothetical protein
MINQSGFVQKVVTFGSNTVGICGDIVKCSGSDELHALTMLFNMEEPEKYPDWIQSPKQTLNNSDIVFVFPNIESIDNVIVQLKKIRKEYEKELRKKEYENNSI